MDEPEVDDLLSLQMAIILVLLFAIAVTALTLHPDWFGGLSDAADVSSQPHGDYLGHQ